MATLASLVVNLTTNTAQFDRGFAGATRTVGNFGRSAEGMERGMRIAENGFRNLAFRAVGLEGPLGKVTEGLLLFGGGSLLVTGVAAGLGVIALAMNAMGKEATEAEKRTKDLQDRLAKARITPLGAATLDVGTANAALGAAQQRQARAAQLAGRFGSKDFRAALANANADVAQRLIDLAQARAAREEQVAAAIDKQNQKLDAQIAKQNKLAADQRAYDIAMAVYNGRTMASTPISVVASGAMPGGLLAPDRMPGLGARGLTTSRVRLQQQAAMLQQTGLGKSNLDGVVSNLNTLSSAILLLGSAAGATGNRFGQFLMGAGGLIGNIPGGQLAGAAIGIGGAIINLFGGGGDKAMPVKVTNPQDLMPKHTGPDKVSINFIGSNGEVIKTADVVIRRRQARDGVVRVPFGTAAAA